MDTKTRTALASNIAALRIKSELSQNALAKRAGIAQTAVSYCERADGKSPTLETIDALARAFRVPAWWLLMDHGVPDPSAAAALGRLADAYTKLPEEGRAQVLRVAEAEARYYLSKR